MKKSTQPTLIDLVIAVRIGEKKLSEIRPGIRAKVERLANDKSVEAFKSKPRPAKEYSPA